MQTQALTYGTTSNRLTDIDTQSVTSDNNGNSTAIHGMTLTHDTHNRLSSATVSTTTTNYAYNGLGERVAKQTGSNISHYLHAGPQLLAEYDDVGNVEREYIYLYDQPVVMLDHTGSGIDIYWIHNDHLGRPLALTDATGAVVWRWLDADAFGNQASVDEDPDNDTVDLVFNLRFPGQYFDAETGFHYNYFRYYDPAIGRYITSDPIGLKGGLNRYTYVDNNPIKWIDPEGLAKKDPNTTSRKCKTPEWDICKARCGNKGVLACQVQVTKKVRRTIDNNGKIIQRLHFDEAVNCECGDDDPSFSCGETCQKTLLWTGVTFVTVCCALQPQLCLIGTGIGLASR